MLDIKKALKDIMIRLNIIADYVVERRTSGYWNYTEWSSGRVDVTYSGFFTFTTGAMTASLPSGWRIVSTTEVTNDTSISYKMPVVIANGRYIGDTRSANVDVTPSSLYDVSSSTNSNSMTLYIRVGTSVVNGSYYVDIIIHGYKKE